MAIVTESKFKLVPGQVQADGSLSPEHGWHKMDVRWLITSRNLPSTQTVVGWTTMPPGVKARHALHRHPHAEEWEYVVQGVGI
jgi:quercetin dioxygenase-like cupin family protein